MKRYSFFQAFYLSFYSRELYQDAGLRWQGSGLAYLSLLLALSWVFYTMGLSSLVQGAIEKEAPALIAQMPTITVDKGELSFDIEQPHTVYVPDPLKPGSQVPLLVIDTTATVRSLDDSDARMLLTKTRIYSRDAEGKVVSHDLGLQGVEHEVIERPDMQAAADAMADMAALVIYPLGLFFIFIYRLIQMLVYALFGLLMANILRYAMDYQSVMRLSCIALTPPILLDALFTLMQWQLPYWSLLSFAMAMGYLFFGISACRDADADKPQDSGDDDILIP